MLETAFWQRAAASLPQQVRNRYALELARAEHVDATMGRAVEAYRRAKAAIGRWFAADVALRPRSHHP